MGAACLFSVVLLAVVADYYCPLYQMGQNNSDLTMDICDDVVGPSVFDSIVDDVKALGGASMLTEWGTSLALWVVDWASMTRVQCRTCMVWSTLHPHPSLSGAYPNAVCAHGQAFATPEPLMALPSATACSHTLTNACRAGHGGIMLASSATMPREFPSRSTWP